MDQSNAFTIPLIVLNDTKVMYIPPSMSGSETNLQGNSPKVVVSGISCRLPESDNMEEFWQNLSTSVDMVTTDDRRWKPGLHGLPERNGKLKDIVHFDADFFKMKPFQANAMDPQLRLLLEVTHEAIIDAGYNPSELRGSNTSVYVGNMNGEAFDATGSISAGPRLGHGFIGANESMFSNSVSYYFDFKGPSMSINTACSASLTCLDRAARTIISGESQHAIAAGVNILFNPQATSLHFVKLRALSADGTCKTFDASANGYVRSEGIVAVFLTAEKLARRNYANILNTMSAHDGYKVQGISYPSGEEQVRLISSTHERINLDPRDVYYVEAHGTGTSAGDYEECMALDRVFGSSEQLESRKQPLLIGSVKSNMGHSEATAGLAGVAKLILSFQHGVIPPNIHLRVPNPRIMSIVEGRLVVVTETTPMPSDAIVGINSFGFGGATAHAVLQGGGEREKEEEGDHTMERVTFMLPVSSRTEAGLTKVMDFVEANRTNKELLSLISTSMTNTNVEQYPYRGYVLWNDEETSRVVAETEEIKSSKPQVWFIFAGLGSQCSKMGSDLLKYPIFAATIQRCYDVLPSSVSNLVSSPAPASSDNATSFVNNVAAICAISIAQCVLLKAVGIEPDHLVGHSLGELILSYADGALTLEQCMLLAYWRSMCTIQADIEPGAMAAVGLPWDKVATRCPSDGVWLACNNCPDNVTISGKKEAVLEFVAELKKEKVVTSVIDSFDMASHSPLMAPLMNPRTLEILRKIIPEPKPPSEKWVITSLPEGKHENVLCSGEFHVQSTMAPVFFYEAIRKIPSNSIVIEIGPHALLHSLIKRSVQPGTTLIQLQNRRQKEQDVFFMNVLGNCYNAGLNVNPLALLRLASLSVGPKTPSIGHLMSWDHSEEWFVPKPEHFLSSSQTNKTHFVKTTKINTSPPSMFDSFLLAHYKVNGDVVVPPSFLLQLVWECFEEYNETTLHEMTAVIFSDVSFHKMLFLMEEDVQLTLTADISSLSGHFEVSANDQDLVVTGNISTRIDDTVGHVLPRWYSRDRGMIFLTSEDIYKEMALKGYEIDDNFRVLLRSPDPSLQYCFVLPPLSESTVFAIMLEAAFQMNILHHSEALGCEVYTTVLLPSHLDRLELHPRKMLSSDEDPTLLCYHGDKGVCSTANGAIHLENLTFSSQQRKPTHSKPYIESYSFLEYQQYNFEDIYTDSMTELRIMLDIVEENVNKKKIHMLQIMDAEWEDERMMTVELSAVVKAYFKAEFLHDILLIGLCESNVHHLLPETTGNTYRVEFLVSSLPPEMPTYDLIVMPISLQYFYLASEAILPHLAPGGFLLLNGPFTNYDDKCTEITKELTCVANAFYPTPNGSENIVQLYRHTPEENPVEDSEVALVQADSSDPSLSWFSELKKHLSENDGPRRVYCISECGSFKPSGLIGLVNCLRREGYADRLRCVYLMDTDWEEFHANHSSTWGEILRGDLVMNVVKDLKNGSFRYLPQRKMTPLKDTSSSSLETSDISFNTTRSSLELSGFTCDPTKAYIITGGFKEYSLDIADWLVNKGATILILTSYYCVTTGYQLRRLEAMKKKGARVSLEGSLDVSVESQAFELVKIAVARSSSCAIFHLDDSCKDCLFKDQTKHDFNAMPVGAINLDKALRTLSNVHPNLRSSFFVCFSSVSAGWGSPGHTNHAFASSLLERLCEQRVEDGLHGLAIQWGAIDGAPYNNAEGRNMSSFTHTRPQSLNSFLSSLDILLNSKSAVVSCCIPELSHMTHGEKMKKKVESETTSPGAPDLKTAVCYPQAAEKELIPKRLPKVDVHASVCRLLGIRNPLKVDKKVPLSSLGLDSLTASELYDLLERECNFTSILHTDLAMMSLADLVKTVTSAAVTGEYGVQKTTSTSSVDSGIV